MSKYETVIGIETHVQLKTKTKLFCSCDNDAREAEPNTKVCPVCLGLPGTLPVLNEQAVTLALRVGLALNAEIPERTKFDRKNYFYPDLPKGYQITQFDQPIVAQGHVDVTVEGEMVRVGITRAHMEEDAGKLTHPDGADYSLVDLNRAGTPLMEIVSEPDMRSPAQAKAYAQEIYNLMRYADVSYANLYYGNMRFDVNISLRPIGSKEFGTRAEIKNLNSFRAVEKAAEYEVLRQAKRLDAGEKVIQETRGWNDAKQQTYSQRSKEEAHDYRYFPEPDLPPLVVTKAMREEAEKSMPTMPGEIRRMMLEHGLSGQSAAVLVNHIEIAKLFLSAANIEPKHAKRVGNWLIGLPEEASAKLEENLAEDRNWKLAKALVDLSEMVEDNKLSSTGAKQVLENMLETKREPVAISAELNLIQNSDTGAIEQYVDDAIKANPKSVEDYQAGKAQAFGFLVGQVMKISRGQANPQMVNQLLKEKLKG